VDIKWFLLVPNLNQRSQQPQKTEAMQNQKKQVKGLSKATEKAIQKQGAKKFPHGTVLWYEHEFKPAANQVQPLLRKMNE
jgi:hypothetical protein